jgi:hypothetical protein
MKHSFLLLFIFLFDTASAQVFETVVTNNYQMYDSELFPSGDGGCIFIGGWGNTSVYDKQIVKVDSLGNVAWARKYSNGLQCAAQLGASQFLVYDIRDSFGWQSAQYGEVCVFDSSGLLVSATTIAESLLVNIIHPTPDRGTIAIGYDQGGNYDQQILKTDSSGTLQWIKQLDSLGRTNRIGINDVVQTNDGGFFISASYQYPDTALAPGYTLLVRYDSALDTLWTKSCYAFPAWKITCTPSDEFLLTSPGSDPSFTLISSTGFVKWSRAIPDSLSPFNFDIDDCTVAEDGNFIFTGRIGYPIYSDYVAKVDTMGTLLWMRKISKLDGYANEDNNVVATDDGFIVGFISGLDRQFIALVKTDLAGNSNCDSAFALPPFPDRIIQTALLYKFFNLEDVNVGTYNSTQYPVLMDSSYTQLNYCLLTNINPGDENNFTFEIYPNPATNEFGVRSGDSDSHRAGVGSLENRSNCALEIFNILGAKIYSTSTLGSGPWKVDCRNFPSGVYLLRLRTNEAQLTKKLIIE